MGMKTFFAVSAYCLISFVQAGVKNPLAFPKYEQTVVVTFASRESAQASQMKIAELPDGAVRSFGTRWDDTSPMHIKKADMLERAGVKGAFYITAKGGDAVSPNSFRYAGIRKLVERGHAIGNHTLTHPYMVDFSPEARFEEILLTRIRLERDTDHAVTSYASPFGWYGKRWINSSEQLHTVKMLIECGMWVSGDNPINHLGVPEDVWYPAHRFSADDRNPNHERFMAGLKRESAVAEKSPLSPRITLGTHSWCNEEGNALQEKWLKENCVKSNWVQLNDYEYGAYRYSVLNGAVTKKNIQGNKVVFAVERFSPAALGDPIALSVSFTEAPLTVECDGAVLQRGAADTWRLPHSASKKALSRIGLADADGKCVKLPEVEMIVQPDVLSKNVKVVFSNKTDSNLSDIYGVVHLPPEFKNRRRTFEMESLPAGGSAEKVFDFGDADPAVFPRGETLCAASVDFVCKGESRRIWAVSKVERKSAKLLIGDTAMLTPVVSSKELDSEKLKALSAETGKLEPVGGTVNWIKRRCGKNDAYYIISERISKKENEALSKIGGNKAYAIALQFIAREGVDIKLFTNILSCSSAAEIYMNGSRIKVSGREASLNAKTGVNRIVVKVPFGSTRHNSAAQLAVCENGLLGSPCESIPFEMK